MGQCEPFSKEIEEPADFSPRRTSRATTLNGISPSHKLGPSKRPRNLGLQ